MKIEASFSTEIIKILQQIILAGKSKLFFKIL